MIKIKSARELEKMRSAGQIVARVLRRLEEIVEPGIELLALDAEAEKVIRDSGAIPLFKGYRGFPGTICASVNEQVVHGIPGSRRLIEGDIVSIDVGANFKHYSGDAARTFAVGKIEDKAERLINICRDSLQKAIDIIKPGINLSDISRTIQQWAESNGTSVVKAYSGHGIGRSMHEDPQIPNYVGSSYKINDPVLREGMTLAIEPMVNLGAEGVGLLEDGWTVVTSDGSLSAHFEDTVAIVKDGAEVLTR